MSEAKRRALQKGDEVIHSLTGTHGVIRHVFKSDVEVLFWNGPKAIVQWEPKRHWVLAKAEPRS